MNLKKFISGVSALTIAASALAAMAVTANAASPTLKEDTAINGYVAAEYYDFTTNTPEILPTSGDIYYRSGYGLHNFAKGGRTVSVDIGVTSGQLILAEVYNSNGADMSGTTINSVAKDDELSTSSIYAYGVTADAESLSIYIPRYGGVRAILVMDVDTDAPADTLVVNYKYGDDVVFADDTIDITGKHVGDTITVPFRAYVEKDGVLYTTTKNSSNPWYGDSVTLAADTVVTKSVTPVNIEGTVELFADLDDGTGENADIRASYQSAYSNKSYTSANEIPAGQYTFIVYAQNKGRGSSIVVGDTTVATIDDVTANKGAWTWKTFDNVEITEGGKVSLVKGGNNTIDCYDIIIAIKTGDYVAPVTTTEAGFTFKSTIEKLAGSTVTLKVTASNGTETKEGDPVDITEKLDGFDGELMLAVILTDVPEGITIESATIEVE